MALKNLTNPEIDRATLTDLVPSMAELFLCTPEEHKELENLRIQCNAFLRERLREIRDGAPGPIDYRKILRVYVDHVLACEGVNFLGDHQIKGQYSLINMDLTAREMDILLELRS